MRKPEVGQRVMVVTNSFDERSPMIEATVTDLLSAQFIAEWKWSSKASPQLEVDHMGYFLYSDRGQTWKFQ